MSQERNQNFLSTLLKYLPLIVLAATMILAYGSLRDTTVGYEKRISSLESVNRDAQIAQNTMLVQLSQIQTDLQWIKSKIR